MNRQHLLSRLGKMHDILYSPGILGIWQRHTQEWRNATCFGSFQHRDSIVDDGPSKLILRWPTVRLIDTAAIRIGVRRWKLQLNKMGSGPLVAHVFHPVYWPYVGEINPDFLVYHPYDLFSQQPAWSRALADGQSALLARADLVMAPSRMLADELAASARREVKTVLNAADFDAFAGVNGNVTEPADLLPIPRPRIGYTGNLNRKVDFALIADLATRNPAWHFVFVGTMGNLDAVAERSVGICRKLPNVHFLGGKSYVTLPSYVLNMDVNIMCYRLGGDVWTRVAYPLKLHEYLAAGRPVVSADLQSLHRHRDILAIASGTQEWEKALGDAIMGCAPGDSEARRAVASRNTWDQRVQQLNQYLIQMVQQRGNDRRGG